ncbi:MAG TPA: DJ-1/PfpI family protein [Candidatus Micrarchaeota archaeon]|nr:DJ-1/PfpI family protein [Candidatus Micrarchaeota archaeon]
MAAKPSIAFVIAFENFRDEEFFVPYEHLKGKADCEVFSTKTGMARGKLGGTFKVDKLIDAINPQAFDAIVYIGGPGTPSVRAYPKAVEKAKEMNAGGKSVCAICWAPTILAKAGVLAGRKATCWLGFDDEYGIPTDKVLMKYGAVYEKKGAVQDGKIITADGPEHAKDFALLIGKALGLDK